ncbi:MAG: hypothetical protein B5M54_02425 [Candidatus Aminicenantes bacterium 4484_214]|nr:MAG: hypothetical protein B5M54_02425 [Candidatus Aminicenantes bacterium 4484_214]RLE07946.1 MAG: hypothetical protein DRJ06_05165 [Candidatus Aminicenantes bacterium]
MAISYFRFYALADGIRETLLRSQNGLASSTIKKWLILVSLSIESSLLKISGGTPAFPVKSFKNLL